MGEAPPTSTRLFCLPEGGLPDAEHLPPGGRPGPVCGATEDAPKALGAYRPAAASTPLAHDLGPRGDAPAPHGGTGRRSSAAARRDRPAAPASGASKLCRVVRAGGDGERRSERNRRVICGVETRGNGSSRAVTDALGLWRGPALCRRDGGGPWMTSGCRRARWGAAQARTHRRMCRLPAILDHMFYLVKPVRWRQHEASLGWLSGDWASVGECG